MVVFCVPGSVFAETGDEVSTVADTKYAGEVTCSVYQGGTTDYGGSDTYRKMVGSHERSGKWNYYANNEIYLSAPTDESGGKAGDDRGNQNDFLFHMRYYSKIIPQVTDVFDCFSGKNCRFGLAVF
jgi:hypothetical protein